MWRVLLVIAVCASAVRSRLPTSVLPVSYRLSLDLTAGLDNPSGTYKGKVWISLNFTTPDTTNFTLHSSELLILNSTLTYKLVGVGELPVQHISKLDEAAETLTISHPSLPSGEYYLLFIEFEGKLRSDLEGFYVGRYVAHGTTRWMGSTQFEPTYARKAFPCFDQPNLRSKLNLELTLPLELHAVSNMPIFNTTSMGLKKMVKFVQSPAMPTYLFAWYVSDSTFGELMNSSLVNGITYGIHGQMSLKEESAYAQKVIPNVIAGLENFTGITYASTGMSKLDQVGIPDFNSGAMENWALITYRESRLMYNDNYSSFMDQQQILMVIAHEATHQWFGDAATLDWWSHTWLNEGFARFFQYFIPNKIEPTWNLEQQFLTDVFQLSLSVDHNSHPLSNPNVTTLADITGMFDTITYGKGASLLRMFSGILGEDVFKNWIHTYLTNVIKSGGVATPHDLWVALPNSTLAEKFKPWVLNAGHPVVNVSTIAPNKVGLSQIKDDMYGHHIMINLEVPVHVYSSVNGSGVSLVPLLSENLTNWDYSAKPWNSTTPFHVSHWLKNNETIHFQLGQPSPAWYLVNVNSLGFYRVLYDEGNWRALSGAIDRFELPVPVRAQLVSDSLNLMMTGHLDPDVALGFVHFLQREQDLLVWKAALMVFTKMRNLVAGWKEAKSELEMVVRNLMDGALEAKFVEREVNSHYEKVLRSYVAKKLCTFQTKSCDYLRNGTGIKLSTMEKIDRDLDGALFCELVKSDAALWESLFSMYVNTSVPTQKRRYLSSLICTSNSTLQLRLLRSTLDPSVIKVHDFIMVVSGVCDADNGTQSALTFIQTNASEIYQYIAKKKTILKMLTEVANELHTGKLMKEMENLLNLVAPTLHLTSRDISHIKSIARKDSQRRNYVAMRLCKGFQIVCEPLDTSVANYLHVSPVFILAALAISVSAALQVNVF